MTTQIKPLTMRLFKKEVDIFPYWIGFLLIGLIFGAIGAYDVLVNGLVVTGLSDSSALGFVDYDRPISDRHGRERFRFWRYCVSDSRYSL